MMTLTNHEHVREHTRWMSGRDNRRRLIKDLSDDHLDNIINRLINEDPLPVFNTRHNILLDMVTEKRYRVINKISVPEYPSDEDVNIENLKDLLSEHTDDWCIMYKNGMISVELPEHLAPTFHEIFRIGKP